MSLAHLGWKLTPKVANSDGRGKEKEKGKEKVKEKGKQTKEEMAKKQE